MNNFLFKDRDGQTPLPLELQNGLRIKTIQTIGELDEHEEHNIAKGLHWLEKQKNDPKKYEFWIKLHKKMFEQVWSWAGKIRAHEIDNPDFVHPHTIWTELYALEKSLEGWFMLKSFPTQEIAARFHERIETIHPFANGNGRFGRVVTEQICKFHNYTIPSWGQNLKEHPIKRRSEYISSITKARREREFTELIHFMFA